MKEKNQDNFKILNIFNKSFIFTQIYLKYVFKAHQIKTKRKSIFTVFVYRQKLRFLMNFKLAKLYLLKQNNTDLSLRVGYFLIKFCSNLKKYFIEIKKISHRIII